MRFVLHCSRCTGDGPGIACDELPGDRQCPKCGLPLKSYAVEGEPYCWLHRQRMSSRYPVHPNFLFIEYIWKGGHSERFPNAKLFGGGTEENNFSMSPYCEECQRLYEEWSLAFLRERGLAVPGTSPRSDPD